MQVTLSPECVLEVRTLTQEEVTRNDAVQRSKKDRPGSGGGTADVGSRGRQGSVRGYKFKVIGLVVSVSARSQLHACMHGHHIAFMHGHIAIMMNSMHDLVDGSLHDSCMPPPPSAAPSCLCAAPGPAQVADAVWGSTYTKHMVEHGYVREETFDMSAQQRNAGRP